MASEDQPGSPKGANGYSLEYVGGMSSSGVNRQESTDTFGSVDLGAFGYVGNEDYSPERTGASVSNDAQTSDIARESSISTLFRQTSASSVPIPGFDDFQEGNDKNSENDLNAAAALSLLQGSSSSPVGEYSSSGRKHKSRSRKLKRSKKESESGENNSGSAAPKKPRKKTAPVEESDSGDPSNSKKRQKRDTASYTRILEDIQSRDEVSDYDAYYGTPQHVGEHRVQAFKPTSRRQCGLLVCIDCGASIVYIRVMNTMEKTMDTLLYDADGESTSHEQVVQSYFNGQCRAEKQEKRPVTLSELQSSIGKAISLYTGRETSNISQTLSQHVGERVNGKNTGLPLAQLQKSENTPSRSGKGKKKANSSSSSSPTAAGIAEAVFSE
eukprot:gb/GECG01015750.1/.p1 GENE.gb/GECG01015750.1/~~gb/GECG01015750.1/.p1  ORF type:complete len:384 (+),score=66.54 gb/GECG01015750.1/:1-1152(+)